MHAKERQLRLFFFVGWGGGVKSLYPCGCFRPACARFNAGLGKDGRICHWALVLAACQGTHVILLYLDTTE